MALCVYQRASLVRGFNRRGFGLVVAGKVVVGGRQHFLIFPAQGLGCSFYRYVSIGELWGVVADSNVWGFLFGSQVYGSQRYRGGQYVLLFRFASYVRGARGVGVYRGGFTR